jgi:organic solute transporter Ostalpha
VGRLAFNGGFVVGLETYLKSPSPSLDFQFIHLRFCSSSVDLAYWNKMSSTSSVKVGTCEIPAIACTILISIYLVFDSDRLLVKTIPLHPNGITAHQAFIILAAIATLITVLLCAFNIIRHATNYFAPDQQRQYVPLLMFYPLFLTYG